MRYNYKERAYKRYRREVAKTEWHPWFAWYPVHINDHEVAWLEKVRRRLVRHTIVGGGYWEYAAIP
jgi:hypothetical protein